MRKLQGQRGRVCGGRVHTVLAEDGRGHQVLQHAAVAVERAHHLTPHQELADLLGQLPQFLQEEEEAEGHIRGVFGEAARLPRKASRGQHQPQS